MIICSIQTELRIFEAQDHHVPIPSTSLPYIIGTSPAASSSLRLTARCQTLCDRPVCHRAQRVEGLIMITSFFLANLARPGCRYLTFPCARNGRRARTEKRPVHRLYLVQTTESSEYLVSAIIYILRVRIDCAWWSVSETVHASIQPTPISEAGFYCQVKKACDAASARWHESVKCPETWESRGDRTRDEQLSRMVMEEVANSHFTQVWIGHL